MKTTTGNVIWGLEWTWSFQDKLNFDGLYRNQKLLVPFEISLNQNSCMILSILLDSHQLYVKNISSMFHSDQSLLTQDYKSWLFIPVSWTFKGQKLTLNFWRQPYVYCLIFKLSIIFKEICPLKLSVFPLINENGGSIFSFTSSLPTIVFMETWNSKDLMLNRNYLCPLKCFCIKTAARSLRFFSINISSFWKTKTFKLSFILIRVDSSRFDPGRFSQYRTFSTNPSWLPSFDRSSVFTVKTFIYRT